MAVITPTVTHLSKTVVEVIWANIHSGDTCDPVSLPEYPFKTVTARGTWGGGFAAVAVRGSDSQDTGSIDTWKLLHTPSGVEIDPITTGAKTIGDNPAQIAPYVSGGDGSTNITVAILASVVG